MSHKLVNVGFGNSVVSRRVVAIISPNAAPIKRLRDEAREDKRLIDATQGRKTRSVLITDSNHVILSAIQSETIAQRFSPDIILAKEEIEELDALFDDVYERLNLSTSIKESVEIFKDAVVKLNNLGL